MALPGGGVVRDPSYTVAKRIREVRKHRGWSAQRLAEECARAGLPQLNRGVIANIESGRRKQGITLEEMFTLALVLNVAPVHLLVDTSDDPSATVAVGTLAVGPALARAWIAGRMPIPHFVDPRVYFSEVPESEWDHPRPSAQEIKETGEQVQGLQDLRARLYGFDTESDAED